jgi:DNA-binding response OmpR family regulator
LVVEDDGDIRDCIAEVLVEEGFAVLTAQHGAEALDLLQRDGGQQPGLIILDLMMPVMNGWEFHSELLKDEHNKSVPVVVLTGDAHVGERVASLGVAAGLGKPVSLAVLLELVHRHYRGAPISK